MIKDFWEEVMEAIWHDPKRKAGSGIMSTSMIAEYIGMDVDRTENCLRKAATFGYTDRQGGGWVV